MLDFGTIVLVVLSVAGDYKGEKQKYLRVLNLSLSQLVVCTCLLYGIVYTEDMFGSVGILNGLSDYSSTLHGFIKA